MAGPRYVRNPAGGIHSVPDDFEAPVEWGKEGEDWHDKVKPSDVKKDAPWLLGEPHPDVEAAQLHDRGAEANYYEAETVEEYTAEAEAEEAAEEKAGD